MLELISKTVVLLPLSLIPLKTFSHSPIVLVFQREAVRSFGSMLALEF
jgi:hypothetical protein